MGDRFTFTFGGETWDGPADPEPSHCYRIRGVSHPRLGDLKVEGFLCGRLGPPCVQCGDVSDVLCDFPMGDDARTCDRPLCERCAPTVGADKNYCAEHAALGPGLLLFRRPARLHEVVTMADLPPRPRAKPLPKAPPANRRWRVVKFDRALEPQHLAAPLTGWMPDAAARALAVQTGGIVETWAQFVYAWRATHPLKRPKRTDPDR